MSATAAKPAPFAVVTDAIPTALRERPQWVLWRWERRNGKWTKVPYQPIPGSLKRARSNDWSTWGTFADTLAARQKWGERVDGIGYIFSAEDPFCGIDLDKCIDPATGELAEWATAMVAEVDSYSEISPSGTGLKIIAEADLPERDRREGSVEMYCDRRLFTITGRHFAGTPTTIEPRQEQVAALHACVFAKRQAKRTAASANGKQPAQSVHLDDAALLEVARKASNGAAFDRLWRGDTTGYASHSEADAALCAHLAFYTGGDTRRIDRMFRASDLVRDKWDRDDYRAATLAKATEGMTTFYTPPGWKVTLKKSQPERGGDAAVVEGSKLEPEAAPTNGDYAPGGEEAAAEPREDTPARPLPPVPAFPLEALPAALSRFAREAAAALPCPPDLIVMPALNFLGAAIGTTRALRLNSTWRHGPRLYGGTVAEAGQMKSPALNEAAGPVYAKEQEFAEQYERELEEYERELETWEAAKRARGKDKDKGVVLHAEKPRPPLRQRALSTDTTTEALAQTLVDNPRGIVHLRDELTGWVLDMDAYRARRGGDRQRWLSCWSGAPWSVDRKTRKPLFVRNPLVNVVGNIPPSKLASLSDGAGEEDGFVHRLVFSYPDPVPVSWTGRDVSQEAVDGYRALYDALWELQPDHDAEGRPRPRELHLSEAARPRWVEWFNRHCAEEQSDTLPLGLRGPWSKMRGNCAALILILQECRRANEQAAPGSVGSVGSMHEAVDPKTVEDAIAIAEYFKAHARRVYSRLSLTAEANAVARRVEAEQRGWRAFCKEWWARCQGEAKSAGELFPILTEVYLLPELWAGVPGGRERLGHALANHVDMASGEFVVREGGRHSRTNSRLYRLEQRPVPAPAPTENAARDLSADAPTEPTEPCSSANVAPGVGSVGSVGLHDEESLTEPAAPPTTSRPSWPPSCGCEVNDWHWTGGRWLCLSCNPHPATWHNQAADEPVFVVGDLGLGPDGRHYVSIHGSATGIPLDDLEYGAALEAALSGE